MKNVEFNSKNLIMYTVIMCAFLLLVCGISFAYFFGNINTTSAVSVNVTTKKSPLFTAYSSKNISLNINEESMSVANTVVSDNATIVVKLVSPEAGSNVKCKYKISYTQTGSDIYQSPSVPLPYNGYAYEFGIEGSSSTTGNAKTIPTGEGLTKFTLKDLSKLTWNTNTTTLINNAEINTSTTTGATTTWNFTMKVQVLPINQTAIAGKSFNGNFKVEVIQC